MAKLDTSEVTDEWTHEGKLKLEMAPIVKPPANLPAPWKRALAASDPVDAVFDEVWAPVAKILPKTIALFRKTTQAIGLLTTAKAPPSLVYFTTSDDETYGRRGFPAHPVPAKSARGVHADFLALYEVHDGWLDQWDQMGWRRAKDWSPLGSDGPSARFLVTFEGHGPGSMGFDLEETPPSCFIVWNDSKPQRVKNIGKEIDDWMLSQYEDNDARVKAKAKAKPAATTTKPAAKATKPAAKTTKPAAKTTKAAAKTTKAAGRRR